MIWFFRRLMKDRRGNALVIGAACLPLIVGAAGLASDTIQWTLWKRQLQRAADSAAIAGVYDRENASGSDDNDIRDGGARPVPEPSHLLLVWPTGYPTGSLSGRHRGFDQPGQGDARDSADDSRSARCS